MSEKKRERERVHDKMGGKVREEKIKRKLEQ